MRTEKQVDKKLLQITKKLFKMKVANDSKVLELVAMQSILKWVLNKKNSSEWIRCSDEQIKLAHKAMGLEPDTMGLDPNVVYKTRISAHHH